MGNTLRKLPENSPPPLNKQQEVELEEKHQEEEEFTCEICIEPTSHKLLNGNKCSHPFCIDCMIKYIHVKLGDDNEGHIKCPAVNCNNVLDPLAWAPAIGAPLFVRWCNVLCEEALLHQDKCYCPYLDCNVLIINECGGNPAKSKCPSCKRLFCFHCKKAWHEKFRCGQNADLTDDANDVAFARFATENGWIRCPMCRHFLAKRGGCAIVKCRCKTSLCYRCGTQVQKHSCPRCEGMMGWELWWLFAVILILEVGLNIYLLVNYIIIHH